MFQRGPGEGYHAAKAAALALMPGLKCRAIWNNRSIAGFAVENGSGRVFGRGVLAREAWADALYKLRQ